MKTKDSRPIVDEEIIRKGIDIFCKNHHGFSTKHLLEIYKFGSDGYRLAKSLEDAGYKPSEKMVSELGFLDAYVVDAENEEIKKWVSKYNIKPKLKIGRQVTFSIENRDLTGTIVDYDTPHACYFIKRNNDPDKNRKYVVPYENVVSIVMQCMKEVSEESLGCNVCPKCGLGPCEKKSKETGEEKKQFNCSECGKELSVTYRIFYPQNMSCHQCTFEKG
ncbi:hypothetical protein [Serratia marcescens]|uniref:hypothetical protein n=1 Tax=Serratia marcescens TaxID=615 RepID=UPI000A4F40D0|nr:hypothetical protein [Serratia marcescens]